MNLLGFPFKFGFVLLLSLGISLPAQAEKESYSEARAYLLAALDTLDGLVPEFVADLNEIPNNTPGHRPVPRYVRHAPPDITASYVEKIQSVPRNSLWFYLAAALPPVALSLGALQFAEPSALPVVLVATTSYLATTLTVTHIIRSVVVRTYRASTRAELAKLISTKHLARRDSVMKRFGRFRVEPRNNWAYLMAISEVLSEELAERTQEFNEQLKRFTWYMDPRDDDPAWTTLLDRYMRVWMVSALAHHEFAIHGVRFSRDLSEPYKEATLLCHALLGRMGKARPMDQDGGNKVLVEN